MAEKKQADRPADPTVGARGYRHSSESAREALSGYVPTRPVSEADDATPKGNYLDHPDKPDASTIAQVQVLDEDADR